MTPNKSIADLLGPNEELHQLLLTWPHGDFANPYTMAHMLKEAFDLGRKRGILDGAEIIEKIVEDHQEEAGDRHGEWCEDFGCADLRDLAATLRDIDI